MKRSLVKQGAATLMISLPSKWIKKFGLGKGDEVDLEETDNHLVISKDGFSAKKKTNIKLSGCTESAINTIVVNAYRAGYDVLNVYFDTEKQYKLVLDSINNYTIGYEVTKKENNFCVVENITEPTEDKFDILFMKMFYNINLLLNNTEERLKGNIKFEDYKEVVYKIHQYDDFCRRVISKRNIFGNDSNLFWTFLSMLIHGQREIYNLNKYLDKNEIKFKDFEFYDKVKKIFKMLEEGYFKKDIAILEKLHDMEKSVIYKDYYGLIKKNKEENIVLSHMAFAIKNFYWASSPLIGYLMGGKQS